MRLYWLNGGLDLRPEDEKDKTVLRSLYDFVGSIRLGQGLDEVTATGFSWVNSGDKRPDGGVVVDSLHQAQPDGLGAETTSDRT